MAKLKQLLEVLHESTELSTADELRAACELIMEAEDLDSGERGTIRAAFLYGPIDDGSVPCKTSRDRLVQLGYIARGVSKGEEGFNFLTYKGARAYRLIQVIHG